MIINILNSSSSGNCYVYQNDTEALIVEAGMKFSEVQKALNFNLRKVVGCIISHEHGDHSAYVADFLKARINTYASAGTIEEMKRRYSIERGAAMLHPLKAGRQTAIGNFKILPFNVKHDCKEPYGFLISHPEMGTTLFATDTYYLPYKFKGLNNILIECNYSEEILLENVRQGKVNGLLMKRTLQSHMSYDTCLQALQANDLSQVNNIVLIHLSSANSDAKAFRNGIAEATGKTVHVASKGMELQFNKTPF